MVAETMEIVLLVDAPAEDLHAKPQHMEGM